MTYGVDQLATVMDDWLISRPVGRIEAVGRGAVTVSGLGAVPALGDLVRFGAGPDARRGEVIGLEAARVTVLPDEALEGLRVGDRVVHLGPATLAPDDTWIGRILDPYGLPLDGRPLLPGRQRRAMGATPPSATRRRGLGQRLETGLRVFNTLLPLVRGQRIGLFAGSGVGKSSLLARLARRVQADVVVIAMIGERGRELRDFAEKVLGPEGMARSVIVAATSDRSAAQRRRCASAAMTVAEHFRDAGRQVLFLADSVTRLAEAHREAALAAGEAASMRGYPPSTPACLTSLCERAGPGEDEQGDITAIFTVLVAGSDMEEPVADTLRGVLDGHVVLAREIAERGRFPAIDLLRSVSRALPEAASEAENAVIAEARRLLGVYDRAEMMVQAGLYTPGTDAQIDQAVAAWPKLDGFIAEAENGTTADSFRSLAGCLPRGQKAKPTG
ncbi:FliI/YscN family ATPase [Tranquillimonas rosea]|uniref:FliI/YscN family ATPase n=1 Tax=Tranquillimonas rosea TaxID=641238 RepID=UPI003BACC8AC